MNVLVIITDSLPLFPLALLAALPTSSYVLGQEAVTQAEATAGDTTVTWQAGRGLGIRYRGVDAFEPYSAAFTVHDTKWTTAFYTSTRENATAQVTQKGGPPPWTSLTSPRPSPTVSR